MNSEELVLKKEFPARLLFEAGFQRLSSNRSGPHYRQEFQPMFKRIAPVVIGIVR